MAYITQTQLEDRIILKELVDWTFSTGTTIDTDKLNTAIADSDGIIDRELSGLYIVPVTPIPEWLITIAYKITKYHLMSRVYPEAEMLEKVAYINYQEALKILKDIGSGKIQVTGLTAITTSDTAVGIAVSEFEDDAERVFNRYEGNL